MIFWDGGKRESKRRKLPGGSTVRWRPREGEGERGGVGSEWEGRVRWDLECRPREEDGACGAQKIKELSHFRAGEKASEGRIELSLARGHHRLSSSLTETTKATRPIRPFIVSRPPLQLVVLPSRSLRSAVRHSYIPLFVSDHHDR